MYRYSKWKIIRINEHPKVAIAKICRTPIKSNVTRNAELSIKENITFYLHNLITIFELFNLIMRFDTL